MRGSKIFLFSVLLFSAATGAAVTPEQMLEVEGTAQQHARNVVGAQQDVEDAKKKLNAATSPEDRTAAQTDLECAETALKHETANYAEAHHSLESLRARYAAEQAANVADARATRANVETAGANNNQLFGQNNHLPGTLYDKRTGEAYSYVPNGDGAPVYTSADGSKTVTGQLGPDGLRAGSSTQSFEYNASDIVDLHTGEAVIDPAAHGYQTPSTSTAHAEAATVYHDLQETYAGLADQLGLRAPSPVPDPRITSAFANGESLGSHASPYPVNAAMNIDKFGYYGFDSLPAQMPSGTYSFTNSPAALSDYRLVVPGRGEAAYITDGKGVVVARSVPVYTLNGQKIVAEWTGGH